MKLKIRMLSGILGVTMLFSYIDVRAESEFSEQVAAMRQKIEKNIGVMSLSTECAWDVYVELTKANRKYRSNRIGLKTNRNVLQELKQNVERMPIIDSNLTQAIRTLYECYDAQIEQWDTKYDLALEKWKKACEMYSSLSLTMKDTKYSNVFNIMVEYCKHYIFVCESKLTSPSTYYRDFFVSAVNKLEKMYKKPLQEHTGEQMRDIHDIELKIIYELMEPIRRFRVSRKKLPLNEFIRQLDRCLSSTEEYITIFDKGNKLLEFVDTLERGINANIKSGDNFKECSNYTEAASSYFAARVLLRCAEQIRNQKNSYILLDTVIEDKIKECKRCIEKLDKNTLF